MAQGLGMKRLGYQSVSALRLDPLAVWIRLNKAGYMSKLAEFNHVVDGSSENLGCENVLEFRDVPHGALENLKNAPMNKKIHAIKILHLKTKSKDGLVVIDKDAPVFGPLLEKETYYE